MRRTYILFIGLMVIAALLAGCGNSAGRVSADSASIDYTDLPEGIGRGYLAAELPEDSKIMPITLGESAPEFAMTLEDGSTLHLSDLQGRPVMINFWATWCPPCRAEMPGIVDAAAADEELVVLAVNVLEEQELVRQFAEQFGMEMPVVLDANGELRDHYLVRGMPTSVFIDRKGNVKSVWVGLLDEARLEQQLNQIR